MDVNSLKLEVVPRQLINPQFGEAFQLMKFVNPKDGRIEWIWNSRDGVSPFSVLDPRNGGMMQHVDWYEDVFIPNFVPTKGARVFIDLDSTIRGDTKKKFHRPEILKTTHHNVQCAKVDNILLRHFHWLSTFRPYIPPPPSLQPTSNTEH